MLLARRGISALAIYLPGPENQVADALSRKVDNLSYGVRDAPFRRILALFKLEPSLDLFASALNRKCARWYSRTPEDGAAGTNALALPWDPKVLHWLNPPWGLVHRALRPLQE